ncbi:MAG: DNA repair protein RadC [Ahniella sp.]|nr:DNA repair protein RadC [Ahniella sp.]
MKLMDLQPAERPRERLLRDGAAALADTELLAIFLRTGVRGRDALALARDLLASGGGFHGLLSAEPRALATLPGLGLTKAAQLTACVELVRRSYVQVWRHQTHLESPDRAADYFRSLLAHRDREVFACAFLDTRLRLIEVEELFFGTLNQTEVHPREIVKRVLAHNAHAVILAHNHPSGSQEPSRADILLTGKIVEALRLIDVRVLDHLIVAAQHICSMASRGLL